MDNDRGPFLSNPFVARAARWGLLAWSLIGVLVLLYLSYRYVLYPVRIIFAPLVLALIVIYLFNPLVTMLQNRGLPRVWGTLIVYLVVLGLVGVGLAYLVSAVSHQVTEFVKGVPELLARAQRGLTDAFNRVGIHVDTNALVQSLQGNGAGASFVRRITSFTSGVFHAALVLVLGPLIAFYLLVDLPKIRRGAERLIPASRREEVVGLGHTVGDTVGAFFRGQLLVALAVGLVSMLGYFIIGLPFFALLGAVTGLFALVPLIGILLAAVPVLFVALTASGGAGHALSLRGGWPLALGAAVVLVVAQQLDTRVLSPRLQRRPARLNPVTVLLSLLIGGTLLGLWGMLLAVPTVAALKVILLYVWDTRSAWPPRGAVPDQQAKTAEAVLEPGEGAEPAAPVPSGADAVSTEAHTIKPAKRHLGERGERVEPRPRIPARGSGP